MAHGSFRMKSTSYVIENFQRVHDSIKPPVWYPASSPNLSEPSLMAGGGERIEPEVRSAAEQ